jgi:putative acyl-CoA dehydrogenase
MNKPLPHQILEVTADRYGTHKVLNQAQPAAGFNAFSGDALLCAAIEREAPWAAARCAALGAVAGDEGVQELARLANRHTPELKTHDRFGNRIDWVEFHPSWHELMSLAWRHEVPNLSWRTQEKIGHYARAVLSYLWNQVEHGTACPTGMAYASYAGFESEPALAIWKEKSLGTVYEFSRREVGDKPSVVIGYAMTEKQGGSDLRETQTTARFSHSADYHGATAHWYELTGHKWFCSVPQSDGFFTLAKVNGGVTCFFLPRTLPDGSYNRFLVQRLKDKAGNRSNASSEVEYAGTMAIRVGEEGRGLREILSHFAPHPYGFRRRLGGPNAPGAYARAASHHDAQRLRHHARRAAHDDQRAGRHGGGGRGRYVDGAARGQGHRPLGGKRTRKAACPSGDARG